MKRVVLLLSLFLTFFIEPICAQQLHVKRFEKDPNDVKPRTKEGGFTNANGQYCALLKVLLFEEGAQFSGSDMVKASDLEVNKYRVFMSPGAKMLEVAVPRFEDLEIRFADINPEIVALEAGTAYWLVISSSNDGHEDIPIPTIETTITLSVAENAEIWINGKKKGQSNWTGELSSGDYLVETILPNRPKASRTISVSPDSPKSFVLDAPGYYYGSLSIQSTPPVDAAVWIDGNKKGNVPQIVDDLKVGPHHVVLKKSGYVDAAITANVERDTTKVIDIKLEPEITPSENNAFTVYAQAGYQLGALSGLDVNIGTYIKNFNIEGDVTIGLSELQEEYNEITCKAITFGAKVGYGFDVSKKARLTPQIGISDTSISGSERGGQYLGNGVSTGRKDLDCFVVSGAVALRVDFSINKYIGLNLTPQFNMALSTSPKFEEVIEHSSTIKSWGTGFNARLGLYVCF